MLWARLLAYVSGTVDQELLLRNEYLAAENRIERADHGSAAAFGRRKCNTGGDRSPPGSTWRPRPSPKRFWVGIGSSSQTNLMGRNPFEE